MGWQQILTFAGKDSGTIGKRVETPSKLTGSARDHRSRNAFFSGGGRRRVGLGPGPEETAEAGGR
jgi:ribosomal protein L4